MKKNIALLKFGTYCLLAIYAIGFWFYAFISAMYFFAFIFDESMTLSGSSLEQSIRWFILHPLALVIFIVMTIPGLIILGWDDIKKWIEKRRERDLYLESPR